MPGLRTDRSAAERLPLQILFVYMLPYPGTKTKLKSGILPAVSACYCNFVNIAVFLFYF